MTTTTTTTLLLEKAKALIMDWALERQLLPVQDPLYCGDEDKAIELLYQLVQEGKLEEFEPGKYRPSPPPPLRRIFY